MLFSLSKTLKIYTKTESYIKEERKICFGLWSVFLQETGDLRLTHHGALSPYNLFPSLDLWCKDLVLKKWGKTVSDTGLSLCADRMFDFVQEMGDLNLAL